MSDLSLTYGETRILDIAVVDADDAPVNISGSTLYLTVKDDWLDADADAKMALVSGGGGILITSAGGGLAEATVTPAMWTAIANEPDRFVWGLTEKDGSDRVWRLGSGYFSVEPAALAVPS